MNAVDYTRAQSYGDPFIAGVSNDVIEFALETASTALDPRAWGARYKEALAVYALHLIVSSPGGPSGGGAGPVTAERVGAWAKSYAHVQPGDGDAWLNRSAYGQRLQQIRMTRVARLPRIVR